LVEVSDPVLAVVVEVSEMVETVVVETEVVEMVERVMVDRVEVLVSDAVVVVFCAQNMSWSPVYARHVLSQMCCAEQVGQKVV
jgi:hypothetical protein